MPDSQLPGSRWFTWVRYTTLRVGALTGIYLSVVLAGWLVIANRLPALSDFALLRNAAAGALAFLLMLIPIVWFLRSPARLFAAGLTGWALLSLTYLVMGMVFHRLHSRMGPFHFFMLGVVVYGVVGVVAWVASLVLAARRQPIGVARRRPY